MNRRSSTAEAEKGALRPRPMVGDPARMARLRPRNCGDSTVIQFNPSLNHFAAMNYCTVTVTVVAIEWI